MTVLPAEALLSSTPDTVLWGELPCAADDPVTTVSPGDSLVIDSVSHEGMLEDQGRDPLRFFTERGIDAGAVLPDAIAVAAEVDHDPSRHGPHIVTGPIRVRGARPGDVLSITVERLELRADYGIVSNRHAKGALPERFPVDGSTDTLSILGRVDAAGRGVLPTGPGADRFVRFPLRPFLGITGVAVAVDRRVHSVPPGPHGGNIDISLLGVGSTVHLPVQVEGAVAYIGDPHYAQGDGEVALTAFEAPLRATLRFDLVPAAELAAPRRLWGETADLLIPIGLHEDLDEAMRACVHGAVDLLVAAGMHPAYAYAYLSAAGDFAVSQVVDQVCGIHGRIRKSDLADLTHHYSAQNAR
ncbi:acetamidase/formamidase family protein [Nocardia mexicana]|uniref:acetamidase/formamidase family protein n=1 Tax=Nocardia mexicana TaxID=279262 RepID=UPI000A53352C|nr:acetamidase/formamidase family protein [Nocardia mexicana]